MSAFPVLVVIAKAPVAGLAKTRLTPPLSPDQAADLAAAALLDTLDTVAAAASVGGKGSPGCRPAVALTGDVPGAAREDALRASLRRFDVVRQRGTSLAQRLVAAHLDAATLRPRRPTLLVGMDTPQVGVGDLLAAAGRLAAPGPDALLGPANDGGWWAIGLRIPRMARVLARVPTSRGDTGCRTAVALTATGSTLALLPCRRDVDDWADACAVAEACQSGRFADAVRALQTDATSPAAAGGSRRMDLRPEAAGVHG